MLDCALTTGPRVDEFRQLRTTWAGTRSPWCTAALHLSLLAVGVGRGSEVVTTPMTFCATVNVIHCGATVFADIDLETMNLDVETVERAIRELDPPGPLRAGHVSSGVRGHRNIRLCGKETVEVLGWQKHVAVCG